MASCKVLAFAALLLVLLPMVAKGHLADLSPARASYDEPASCDEVECGQGTCRVNGTDYSTYTCECESRDDVDDDNLNFLKCVIPDCAIDYSCQPPPPPVSDEFPNSSPLDRCYWTDCGEGTCDNTAPYNYVCECNPWSSNLPNKTYFPCYRKFSNQATTPPDGTVKASTFLPGKLHWAAVLIISIAMVLWQ